MAKQKQLETILTFPFSSSPSLALDEWHARETQLHCETRYKQHGTRWKRNNERNERKESQRRLIVNVPSYPLRSTGLCEDVSVSAQLQGGRKGRGDARMSVPPSPDDAPTNEHPSVDPPPSTVGRVLLDDGEHAVPRAYSTSKDELAPGGMTLSEEGVSGKRGRKETRKRTVPLSRISYSPSGSSSSSSSNASPCQLLALFAALGVSSAIAPSSTSTDVLLRL